MGTPPRKRRRPRKRCQGPAFFFSHLLSQLTAIEARLLDVVHEDPHGFQKRHDKRSAVSITTELNGWPAEDLMRRLGIPQGDLDIISDNLIRLRLIQPLSSTFADSPVVMSGVPDRIQLTALGHAFISACKFRHRRWLCQQDRLATIFRRFRFFRTPQPAFCAAER